MSNIDLQQSQKQFLMRDYEGSSWQV